MLPRLGQSQVKQEGPAFDAPVAPCASASLLSAPPAVTEMGGGFTPTFPEASSGLGDYLSKQRAQIHSPTQFNSNHTRVLDVCEQTRPSPHPLLSLLSGLRPSPGVACPPPDYARTTSDGDFFL